MFQYFVKHRIQIVLGLVLTLLALWLQTTGQGWAHTLINRLDYLAYDLRLNLTLPPPLEKHRVFIIDIDEASLRAEGRWPWSREKMGALVARLKAAGVHTIGFDVAFTEPERNVAQELIEATADAGDEVFTAQLEQLIPGMDRDQAFASQLKGQNVVLGFLFHASKDDPAGRLPSGWTFVPPEQSERLSVPTMTSYTGNLKVLQKAARYGGFLNTTPDSDGVIRSTPLILRNKSMIYPSLSIAMARRYLDARRFQMETVELENSEAVTGLLLQDNLIPTDRYGRVLVPYLGKRGSIPYIPATEILQAGPHDNFPQLIDALAIVGTSAIGLGDLVSTPTDRALPGVEVHATVLETILNGRPFPSIPDWADAANALVIVVSGLILALVCPSLGALSISLFTAFFIALLLGVDIGLWTSARLSLSPVVPVITVLAIITLNVLWGYFTEAQQKKQVRKAFSSYMAPALVDQLVDNPDMLSLTGETREMTFLFSDIAGFTSFTEKATPEVLVATLNEYLDVMCRAVMEHGGTIDKIVGDAVVGIFNAPLDQPDHAIRAVNCALEMDRISRAFIKKMNDAGYPFGNTRVGVNSGPAIVGNFGGSERFDYTAHGDPINTAARLESVNKHLGTLICISGTTAEQCPDHFFRPVGGLVLKGKTEAIDTFVPITEEESRSPLVLAYNEAFEHLQREEADAGELFTALKAQYPDDPLVNLHHERIMSGTVSATIVLAEK
jgi:adenylate cyclase